MRRGSRDVIDTAVAQLFDAAVRIRTATAASGEYRIDDLARLAGTTTRNIRVYRDRGPAASAAACRPLALFNDTHLTRLRLITSMLDRGYNIAHVREMLSAWEQGKDLGDMLGLEIGDRRHVGRGETEDDGDRRGEAAGRRRARVRPPGRLGLIRIEQDGQEPPSCGPS